MPSAGTEASVPSGSGETGRLGLWLALGGGVVAWALHLVGSYALLAVSCALQTAWLLHALSILTVLPTVYGAWYCYRVWKRCKDDVGPGPRGRSADYQQYMGLCGALLNALFVFAIVLEWLPVFFIDLCLGVP
ncbi:MAG: hypothetical protein AB7P40_05515 [Chloroflexota bacterium]